MGGHNVKLERSTGSLWLFLLAAFLLIYWYAPARPTEYGWPSMPDKTFLCDGIVSREHVAVWVFPSHRKMVAQFVGIGAEDYHLTATETYHLTFLSQGSTDAANMPDWQVVWSQVDGRAVAGVQWNVGGRYTSGWTFFARGHADTYSCQQ